MGKTLGFHGSKYNENVTNLINLEIAKFKNNQSAYIYKIDQESISVEDVNDYIMAIENKSFDKDLFIGIIYNFDKISVSNQNKLLKTIEDNNDGVLQLFVFDNLNLILSTIKSRLIITNVKQQENNNMFLNRFNDGCIAYLEKDKLIYDVYVRIYKLCLNKEYINAYLLYKTKLRKISNEDVLIIQKILIETLEKNEYYKTMFNIVDFERQNVTKVDKNLLIDAMFITVNQSFEVKNGG